MKRKTSKASVDAAIIIAALSLIVSIFSVALQLINMRYSVNADCSKSFTAQFSRGKSKEAYASIQASKGTLAWGWAQTKGSNQAKYTFAYKKSADELYMIKDWGTTFPNNNEYKGPYNICKTNGRDSYNVRVVRDNKKINKASKVNVDLMVR